MTKIKKEILGELEEIKIRLKHKYTNDEITYEDLEQGLNAVDNLKLLFEKGK